MIVPDACRPREKLRWPHGDCADERAPHPGPVIEAAGWSHARRNFL
jgi:hypothetical protein